MVADELRMFGIPVTDGRQFYVDSVTEFVERDRVTVPFSTRIELLREEGQPEIEVDNKANETITPSDIDENGCSCSATEQTPLSGLAGFFMLAGLAVIIRRRVK